MAGQIQLLFLLASIALVNAFYDVSIDFFNHPKDAYQKINIDKLADDLLPKIRILILENGLDPTRLIDFSEPIFPKLPGKAKGNIDFKKGWMQNLSLLKRTGAVTAEYKNKSFTVDMNLGFDVLDFNYEYSLQHLLYKRQGDVRGRLFNLNVNTVITIDLENYYLHLVSLKFTDVGKFYIKFEGRLIDPIVNVLTKAVTVVFRTSVLKNIEERSIKIFSAKIEEWNKNFPRPDRMDVIEKWIETAFENVSH